MKTYKKKIVSTSVKVPTNYCFNRPNIRGLLLTDVLSEPRTRS